MWSISISARVATGATVSALVPVLLAVGCASQSLPRPQSPPPAPAQCIEQPRVATASRSDAEVPRAGTSPDEASPSAGASPSAEASPAAPITRLQVRWGTADGLAYMEVVVGDVDIDARLPMVLALHGLGDHPRVPTDAELEGRMPYRIVMPRAPDPWYQTGFTWLPVRVNDHKTAELSAALAQKADLLAKFLATVRHRLPTVGRPIVTGGSQGGMLTFALAVRHPELVAAAIPVMGWLPPPLVPSEVHDPEAYPPIRAIHGTADHTVPIGPTRVAVKALAKLGLDVKLVEFKGAGHYMTFPMDAQVKTWLSQMVRDQLAVEKGRYPAWN